jgi:hypothetical protein
MVVVVVVVVVVVGGGGMTELDVGEEEATRPGLVSEHEASRGKRTTIANSGPGVHLHARRDITASSKGNRSALSPALYRSRSGRTVGHAGRRRQSCGGI